MEEQEQDVGMGTIWSNRNMIEEQEHDGGIGT